MNCKICGNGNDGKSFSVKEMMFGLGERFDYFECTGCGCIQIKDIPKDMARYYPEGYSRVRERVRKKDIKEFAKRALFELYRMKALPYMYIFEGFCAEASWMKKGGAGYRSRILDVGCGNGALLLDLESLGYRDLTGIDPYIKASGVIGKNVRIHKNDIFNVGGKYDLVMFHHSLEHMTEHAKVLERANELLVHDGRVIIRTPMASSYAWERYGVNWVQLDAPRHLFIHSLKSLGILAGKTGFAVKETVFDSTELQFAGSEQYEKGVCFLGEGSFFVDPARSAFKPSDIRAFREKAKALNKEGRGDQACIYLHKDR